MNERLKDFVIENPALIRGQIYDKVKQAILSGSIPMGSRVLEGRLAEQLSVSRTPVREALHVLEMEGLLESFPRVGYRVREVTWEEALEIYEMRAVLEPLAARKAIESGDRGYIDVLTETVGKSEEAIRQNRLDLFFEYDTAFEEIIVRASGMKTLLDVWATIRYRLKLYKMGSHDSEATRLKSVKGHRRITDCLEAGNKEGVETAIRDHLGDFIKDIRRATLKWGRTGSAGSGSRGRRA
jgi:GntR family transcriptional regulator, rspAB operon transcriptional repressor